METFSALLAICAGNSPVTGEFPAQMASNAENVLDAWVNNMGATGPIITTHDYDVIQWKHFPCYWPFVQGIHWSPVNSPRKGQWRGALMFSLICTWMKGWVNNREAGDLRCHCAYYDVTVMEIGPAGPELNRLPASSSGPLLGPFCHTKFCHGIRWVSFCEYTIKPLM